MHTKSNRHNQANTRKVVGKRERRRVAQLGVCIFLFCIVMIGKGIAPVEMQRSSEKLLEYIRADTDFRLMFSSLGQSFDTDESLWERVRDTAIKTFAGQEADQEIDSVSVKSRGPASQIAAVYLQELPSYQSMLIRFAPVYKIEK